MRRPDLAVRRPHRLRFSTLLLLLAIPCSAVDIALLEADSSAQLTALGNEALVQGRFETAIDFYQRAVAADKTAFAALFNLALAFQQHGQRDQAKAVYLEALRLRPDHPEVLCNLGVLAFQAGDFAQAADRFLESARLAAKTPKDAAEYWFNAGTARERLGQWVGAQRAYSEALALDPEHDGANYNLGTLYLGKLSDQAAAPDLALRHLGEAVRLRPGRVEAWINLGLARERSGGAAAADAPAAFAAAVEAASGVVKVLALGQRARYFQRSVPPRRTAMRDDLLALLAIDGDASGANGMLGSYYFAVGDFDGAIRHLEREVAGDHFDAEDSGDLEARYLLALIYTDHRPDPAKALAHATAYYQHHPDSQKIHELRRRALRLGDNSRKLSPSSPSEESAGPSGSKPAEEAAAGHSDHGHPAAPSRPDKPATPAPEPAASGHPPHLNPPPKAADHPPAAPSGHH
ncbi:hypothetical protein LBMAG53_17990 [Planctomycetota bacterium]|nr:hypothetical protein LBMAG53_17990 [Planctomycetota bacterium]